jgi:hypothetical protein
MKKYIRFAPALLPAVLLTLMSFGAGKWDMLGSRVVNFSLDHDEIVVTGFEGKFDAVKVKVLHGALNMHKMVIHFANGGTQDVELRNNFAKGSSSRVIDLNGDDRVIRKVSFWYDSKNHGKRSLVQLWGKH